MATFPRSLDVVMIGRAPEGTLMMIGNCLGDSAEEVSSALDLLERCPAIPRATQK
jgi:hypothetical protein